MRNIPSCPRLLGNRNYSYDIKLDKVATISVEKGGGLRSPYWKLVYDVDGMTSTLDIFEITDKNSGNEILNFAFTKCRSVKGKEQRLTVEVIKDKRNGLLSPTYLYDHFPLSNYYRESLSGGVETQIRVYVDGTWKVLLVTESKKKGNEKQPYMVTVGHYYVNSGSGESGIDIGFSVVVNIGVVNGQLDFMVDGPVEHPTSALLFMIEEVVRTVKWKPSACPHCKNIQSSKSEDSDTNLPTPPSNGGQQNVSNMGRYNGDGIGNIIQANEVNFNKWWMMRRFRN